MYLKAINLRANVLGKEHPLYASSLQNLAVLYLERGNFVKAEILFLEAKEIREKALGKEDPDYTQTLNALAFVYYNQRDYPKAEPLFLQAIKIHAKALCKENPVYVNYLLNLACLYHDNGNYAKAEPLFLEAKEILAKDVGKENLNLTYARSLDMLARQYCTKGDYPKAEPLFLEAKEIRKKILGKENTTYAMPLNSLAKLYKVTNRIPESADLYLEFSNLTRGLIEKSADYSSESQMLAFLHTFDRAIDEFQYFSQTYPSPDVCRASLDDALFYKGYLLENLRRLTRAKDSADNLTRETFVRWQGCRRLAGEYAKPIAERKYVAKVEAEAEGYEKTLTRNLPAFSETRHTPRWQEVRDSLQAGEAAVEFINYRRYNMPKAPDSTMYVALVLLPGDTMPRSLPLFEERQLLPLLPKLNDAVDIVKAMVKDLYGASPDLRHLLWQPLEPLLRGVKTVYYSPSGLLHRINPAALLDESDVSVSEGRQWVRVGSTRDLVTGRLADRSFACPPESPQGSPENQPTALVYGGITYDMGDTLAFAVANPQEVMDGIETAPHKDGDFHYITKEQTRINRSESDGIWKPLGASGREADEISDLLRGAGFGVEEQKDLFASEERFKKTVATGALHLATHGFAYPDPKIKIAGSGLGNDAPTFKLLDDPMLRSGLLLAGANHYWKTKRPLANHEDGVLVAYEVRDLNLQNTELAVLSACQTGLGDVVGSEGVYGLQRAFRIAGAKFLIVSLWEVPDAETQELMRLFYQNWVEKNESLRDAFGHAQQAMKEKYRNPFLWAGFVLVE